MKKIFLAVILFLLLSTPVLSQTTLIYLPLILKETSGMPTIVEKWKLISPIESTNYVLNPSGEIAGNFSALGGATVTRSTTYQKYGLYSYRVQTGSNGQGVSLTLSALPNETCFATARIRGQLPIGLRFIIGTGIKTPLLIEKIDVDWSLYGVMFNAAECNGRTELRIIQQGNGIGDFYLDGVQVENLEYWTSYCDGDQEGCAWNGSEHAATSTRSGQSYAGGQVKDLFADYGFLVEKVNGAGATPRSLEIDEYSLLPGGELNEIKVQSRGWSLIGKFVADSEEEIEQNRQDLFKLLRKNAQKQPIKYLFYHPKGIREIKAFYSGGLEGDQSVFYDGWTTEDDDKWVELDKYIVKASIQLKSPDPYFYGQGDKAVSLDANDSDTFRTIAGRLRSTGQWSALGPPNAAGTYTTIDALAEDATYIYIGGNFLNFDNIVNADYIVRYNKQTGVYSAMGTGGSGGQVSAIVIMPNGDVIASGLFTSMGGVANTSRIARWNGTAWNALSTGANNYVGTMALSTNGLLYVAGGFTTIGGVAANGIASWNGSAFSAMGTGSLNINVLAFSSIDGLLYIGGGFTTIGGVSANRIATWDGSIYAALGSGTNNTVDSIAIDNLTGFVYLGGAFTTAGGNSANYITVWNGVSFSALGSGMDASVGELAIGNDRLLIAGGGFTSAGGISLADRLARWNGYVWGHWDIDLPGLPNVNAILASKYVDPIIPQKYDLYVGFSTTGTGDFAGKTTVTNEGSVDVFPKFIFERNGGTVITLETIKNETTGKELLFDYDLLDGEQLTIDLTPTKKSIESNYFGDRLDALLANSNFGDFILETGDNDITCFAVDNFSLYPSSLTAYALWKEIYESAD